MGDYAVRSSSAERAAYIYMHLHIPKDASNHPFSSTTAPSDLMHAARDTGTCRRRCQMSSEQAEQASSEPFLRSEILDPVACVMRVRGVDVSPS